MEHFILSGVSFYWFPVSCATPDNQEKLNQRLIEHEYFFILVY